MHKLTSKRQVTLPKAICDTLNLNPGDYVEVFERDGIAYLVKMDSKSLAGVFAGLTSKSIPSSSTLKQKVKQRASEKFGPKA